MTSGLYFLIAVSVFFLFTFPVYPVEDIPKPPVVIPGESESHFMFRTGVFFLMTKNKPDSAAVYLYTAREAGDFTNNVKDSINYYLTECYLALGNPEIALETNLSISDNSDFNAKTWFQRSRIFTFYGMDEEASDLIQLILAFYPDSEEAANLRSSNRIPEPSDDPKFLKLGMFLKFNEKHSSGEFETTPRIDENPPGFGEFGPKEWKTSLKTTFLLNFNITPSHTIDIRPSLKFSSPTQAFINDMYHFLALDIHYMITPSVEKYHELTFSYINKIQSDAIPSRELALGWAFTYIVKNNKSYSASLNASYLPSSRKNEKTGYYFSALLSQFPLLALGSGSTLNGWFLGMYSSLETQNGEIPASRLYGNGAIHGNTIGSTILYTDSTFTDSDKMDLYQVYKKSHRLDGRALGEHIPARLVTGTLGLDYSFSIIKWLSLRLHGQYESSFYIDYYRFDNTYNCEKNRKSGEIYLFLNRSDNQEYLIYKQPKDDASEPDVYRFKKYESVKKRRWDNALLIRPGIDLDSVQWMAVKIYAGFAWNIISFFGNGKHSYTNYAFIPGFECSFRF